MSGYCAVIVISPEKLQEIIQNSINEYKGHIKKSWRLPFKQRSLLQFFSSHNQHGVHHAEKLLKKHPLKAALGVEDDIALEVIQHLKAEKGGTRRHSFKTILVKNLYQFFSDKNRELKFISQSFEQISRYVRENLNNSYQSTQWQQKIYLKDKPWKKISKDEIRERWLDIFGIKDSDEMTLWFAMNDIKNKIKEKIALSPNDDNAKVCLLIFNEMGKFLNIYSAEYDQRPYYNKGTLFNGNNPALVEKLLGGWKTRFDLLGLKNDYAEPREEFKPSIPRH